MYVVVIRGHGVTNENIYRYLDVERLYLSENTDLK